MVYASVTRASSSFSTLEQPVIETRCFSEDTLVYTSKGYQPINEIQEGDDVFSRNPETGEVGFRKVEEQVG